MWDPPSTVGLTNVSYHLTVTNMNTGVVIINTTTTATSYQIGIIAKPCTNYSATVTTFSSEYTGPGISTSTVGSSQGGECFYILSFPI